MVEILSFRILVRNVRRWIILSPTNQSDPLNNKNNRLNGYHHKLRKHDYTTIIITHLLNDVIPSLLRI